MKSLLFATAALVVLASPAFTADLQPAIGAPPGAHNWTGLYFGGHCGGAWGDTRTTGDRGAFDSATHRDYSLRPAGWVCGGELGFNMQISGWFWGIESDFGYLGLKASITQNASPRNFVEVNYGFYGVAAGRAGVVVDRALLYAKAGVAFAQIRNTASHLIGGVIDPADFTELDKMHIGWAAGTGIEYGLSSSWSVKLEYLYLDFGTADSSDQHHALFTHHNSVHTLKAGLNWHFGGGPALAMNYY